MNWKWPATETNTLHPWYKIVKGLVMLPFAVLFTLLLVSVISIGWGYNEGKEVWRGINLF